MVVRFAPRRELMKSEGGAFSASSSEFWESPSRPVADLANDIVIAVEKRPEEAVGAVGAVGLFGTSSAAGNTQESGVLKFAAGAQGRNGKRRRAQRLSGVYKAWVPDSVPAIISLRVSCNMPCNSLACHAVH